jgi:predicted transcriptional regulator
MLFVRYRRMGQELAEERKKLGMSQERLAKTTGIDQAEISRIERDIVDPRLGTYVKLLEGVGLGLRVERVHKGAISKPRQVSARRVGCPVNPKGVRWHSGENPS